MGRPDDFGLWEREFDEQTMPRGDRATPAIVVAMAVGCTLLVLLGQAPLGVAGLIVMGLILLLWRIGM